MSKRDPIPTPEVQKIIRREFGRVAQGELASVAIRDAACDSYRAGLRDAQPGPEMTVAELMEIAAEARDAVAADFTGSGPRYGSLLLPAMLRAVERAVRERAR